MKMYITITFYMPMQYTDIFSSVKIENSIRKKRYL